MVRTWTVLRIAVTALDITIPASEAPITSPPYSAFRPVFVSVMEHQERWFQLQEDPSVRCDPNLRSRPPKTAHVALPNWQNRTNDSNIRLVS